MLEKRSLELSPTLKQPKSTQEVFTEEKKDFNISQRLSQLANISDEQYSKEQLNTNENRYYNSTFDSNEKNTNEQLKSFASAQKVIKKDPNIENMVNSEKKFVQVPPHKQVVSTNTKPIYNNSLTNNTNSNTFIKSNFINNNHNSVNSNNNDMSQSNLKNIQNNPNLAAQLVDSIGMGKTRKGGSSLNKYI